MRFAGRVAIVTGGGAGIGRATCLAFAREGAAVAVVDLRAADTVAGDIETAGGRAATYAADVSRSADVEAMVADVVRRFGTSTSWWASRPRKLSRCMSDVPASTMSRWGSQADR